jgi:hypothetical protein
MQWRTGALVCNHALIKLSAALNAWTSSGRDNTFFGTILTVGAWCITIACLNVEHKSNLELCTVLTYT